MIRLLDQQTLDTLSREALSAPRRRKNLNLHSSLEDPLQKLFIAMQADSYIRPHRHPEPEKTELFIAIRGRFAVLIFDANGILQKRYELEANGKLFAAEIKPETWHTVIALDDGAVFLEVKQGPYTPLTDKHFADWAPAENTAGVSAYLNWLQQAQPGQQSPAL